MAWEGGLRGQDVRNGFALIHIESMLEKLRKLGEDVQSHLGRRGFGQIGNVPNDLRPELGPRFQLHAPLGAAGQGTPQLGGFRGVVFNGPL